MSADVASPDTSPPTSPTSARTRLLLEGPILATLLRLSAPNVLNLLAITGLITFDGLFVARLGPNELAGVSLPAKVLGFLDLAGSWDPSLAFVMAGAITVGSLAFAVARKRTLSFLGAAMKPPTSRGIDRRLVIGSVLFGIGWGVAGFCPGPGLVALGMGEPKALVFVIAMLIGMGIFELLERRRQATFLMAV